MGHVLHSLPFTHVTIEEGGVSKVWSAPIPGMEGRELTPPPVDQVIAGEARLSAEVVAIWRREVPVRFMGPLAQCRFETGAFPIRAS